MTSPSRPEHKLNLDYLPQVNFGSPRSASSTNANSPIEAPVGAGARYPIGNGLGTAGGTATASPGSRLFPKRAREIQAQEGLAHQSWGPPPTGSGHSTPLRESILESPSSDGFPDFNQPTSYQASAAVTPGAGRRLRAGTVPSRFSPINNQHDLSPQPPLRLPSQPSQSPPSSTPVDRGLSSAQEMGGLGAGLSPSQRSTTLLNRLRAGSMPQRAGLMQNPSPFGPAYFSSNGWNTPRDRAGTLQSVRPSGGPSSPTSRDSFGDNDVKTLDYLGLVDSPPVGRLHDMPALRGGQGGIDPPTIAELAALTAYQRNANRFRSYSVNATEKYADGEEDELAQLDQYTRIYGTPMAPAAEITAAQAMAISDAVRQHNLDVQAFASLASANRPRAQTAGVLDSPSSRITRSYLPTHSRLGDSYTASDLEEQDTADYNILTDAVRNMKVESHSRTADETLLETPTRALWLGNIPPSTTVSSLNVIFGNFGPIESTRVLTHKSCGFVNFESVDSAIAAKQQLNNKEIFPGAGAIRIGFAKVPSTAATPGAAGAFPPPSPDSHARERADLSLGQSQSHAAGLRPANINEETAAAALVTPKLRDLCSEVFSIVQELGAAPDEQRRIASVVEHAINYDLYHSEIPILPEPTTNRMHDAPRLREIRKRIDNNSCSQVEVEDMAMDTLPEVAELASDYLGNTVVQKLFEHCSEPVKEAMLAEIAPHLAEIGVHKNGTWAAQKIIDVAKTPAQMHMIVEALRPYAVTLFLDQYGNYVMQCCLRFGAPMDGFIFDVMLNRLWEVAQGRFGARAMRACLESHFATKDQQRMMAAAVALHSVQLATNANGALLLTWFLDTCSFPRRRSVLAPRLIPHLVHLCTHKVAYLTVLKIINQRSESDARDAVLRALFFSPDDGTLQDILSDQTCGATFIFKVLTTPFLDDKIRPEVVDNVRKVLLRLNAQPQHGYKRLMDEVGLKTRSSGASGSRDASRTRSGSRGPNGRLPHLDSQHAYGRQQYSAMPPQQMEHLMNVSPARPGSVDSAAFEHTPYTMGAMMTPSYTHSPGMANMAPLNSQQMQYQQAMLAQQQAAANAHRASGYYAPMNGYSSPGAPMMDAYGRSSMNASPMGISSSMQGPGQSGFSQPGFNQMMGYQYPTYYNQVQGHPQQGQVGGQRRGRVRPEVFNP